VLLKVCWVTLGTCVDRGLRGYSWELVGVGVCRECLKACGDGCLLSTLKLNIDGGLL